MKSIFEEYGSTIITVMVIVALIAIVGVVVAANGNISTQFTAMITNLFNATGVKPVG